MQIFSLQKFFDFVLDVLFPKKCVVCGKLDQLFCDPCRQKILFLKQQNCPFCLRLMPRGRVCPSCRRASSLTGVLVMAHFEEPLKTVIYGYKYNFLKALREDLADLAWPYLTDLGDNFLLTFVPSDKKRQAWRGYNQAQELAEMLGKRIGAPFEQTLIRKKFETPQTALTKKERFQNVEGAFDAVGKVSLRGKKIVIVDDLVTSGATLNACAKELRKQGAREVWGFALARHN